MNLSEFHNVLKSCLGRIDDLKALKTTVELFLVSSCKPMNIKSRQI